MNPIENVTVKVEVTVTRRKSSYDSDTMAKASRELGGSRTEAELMEIIDQLSEETAKSTRAQLQRSIVIMEMAAANKAAQEASK